MPRTLKHPPVSAAANITDALNRLGLHAVPRGLPGDCTEIACWYLAGPRAGRVVVRAGVAYLLGLRSTWLMMAVADALIAAGLPYRVAAAS